MTPEEVIEYNKRCAEFLELELAGPGFPSGYFYKEYYYHFEDIKFHSDWNWIIEVLIKITSVGYNWELIDFNGSVKEIKCFKCSIFNLKLIGPNNEFMFESEDVKEAVISAINSFLIWYNEQPK